MTMIEETSGDLFESNAEALVNPVNCVGVMGKGLALQFAKKFPDMLLGYKKVCKSGELMPGRIYVYETNGMWSPRYVFNFPTKSHWREKSRLEDIDAGLDALANEIKRRQVKNIALPALGCGLGALDWEDVRNLIEMKLGSLVGVHVLLYSPGNADKVPAKAVFKDLANAAQGAFNGVEDADLFAQRIRERELP